MKCKLQLVILIIGAAILLANGESINNQQTAPASTTLVHGQFAGFGVYQENQSNRPVGDGLTIPSNGGSVVFNPIQTPPKHVIGDGLTIPGDGGIITGSFGGFSPIKNNQNVRAKRQNSLGPQGDLNGLGLQGGGLNQFNFLDRQVDLDRPSQQGGLGRPNGLVEFNRQLNLGQTDLLRQGGLFRQQQGGFAQQGNLNQFSGLSQQGDLSQQSGFNQLNGFNRQNNFGQLDRFPQVLAFDQQGGLNQQRGFAQQGDFSQLSGFSQQNGLNRQNGFGQQDRFRQQLGFGQQSNLNQQDRLAQQGGFTQQGDFGQQNGLRPLNNFLQTDRIRRQGDFFFQQNGFRPQQGQSTTNSNIVVTTTTPPPTTATTSSPQYLNCLANCPTTNEYNPVCGSDSINYHNGQKLTCAQNCGKSVQQLRFGTCQPL